MKKTSVICMIMVLLIGCSSQKTEDKLILTSFYPIYIATLNVTGDIPGIQVVNMTPSQTGCLHNYQLTPSDAGRIEKASVLVVNGGGMESFLDKAVSLNEKLLLLNASTEIEFMHVKGDHHEEEHKCEDHDHIHHHHHHHEINAHVWVSISNAIKQVNTIAEGLAQWDSANSAQYKENAESYIQKLKLLKEKMHRELDSLSDRTIVTFHDAFPYFAREFGLDVAAVIAQEPGSEPSAAELIGLVKTIREKNVKALFVEPQYVSSTARTISRETGMSLYTFDPVATGPLHKDAYLEIMERNLKALKEALK
ncbi:MAG: metal ABC transporter substrate-binding protein [Chitinispirillaceae bacterium]